MGSIFKGPPKAPKAPDLPADIIPVRRMDDPLVKAARARTEQLAALAGGSASNILTSPLGLDTAANTTKKKTLGS